MRQDNCTSTALALSGFNPNDVACTCASPGYLNVYGPCVFATCSLIDAARMLSASHIIAGYTDH